MGPSECTEASKKPFSQVHKECDPHNTPFVVLSRCGNMATLAAVKGGSAHAARPAHVPLPQDQVHSTKDDLSGTGEEEFAIGMRQNAMERDAADEDQDQMLDYNEFKRCNPMLC